MMSHSTHPRPLGPRSIARAASPIPSSMNLPETSPLVIRKAPKLSLQSLSPPSRDQSRSPSLGPPPLPRSRNASPKPAIQIAIPLPNGVHHGPDSPIESGYYGGGPTQINTSANPPDEMTIRPASGPSSTEMPPHSEKPAETVDDLGSMMKELQLTTGRDFTDDDFEVLSRLGEGAGGAVHKVKLKVDGNIYARKTITTREAPLKQLLRELKITANTSNPNIIKFYGAYNSPSSSEVMIVMEFCEGGSLEAVGKRIKERGAVVGEKIAGRLAEGILQGLAFLHAQKTIHRDIKPSNILLSRQGIVKLCDFGVSGELVESMAGTFTGTSFYMAPERICGHEYSIRADVWSTGISLLELVQNRFPFPNDLGPIELMMYITTGEPPRLEDGDGVQWSDDMKDFIKQALTVDAATRPIPRDMLKHPWIVGVMKQEVHMARWIRQVWGWPKSSRRSRDQQSLSRPSTSTADSRPSSSHRTDSSGGSPGRSPETPEKSDGT